MAPQHESLYKRSFWCFQPSKKSSYIFPYSILTRKIKKKLANFDSESWVNLFEKIQYGTPNMKVFINALFGIFSRLKHCQTSFFYILTKINEKNFQTLTPNPGLTLEKSNMAPQNENRYKRCFRSF